MTQAEERTADSGQAATLQHNHASMGTMTVLGLAAMQIGPGIALAGGYLILYAGNASWLAMLGALLATAALGVGVTAFARRFVVSGGLISYVGSVLGPWPRAFAAAGYLVGLLVSMAAVATGVVIFTASFLLEMGFGWGSSAVGQAISAVVLTACACALAYRGLDTSVRVSVVLTFAGIPFAVWVSVAAIANTDFSLVEQFNFSGADFRLAVVIPAITIAAANFVGFEGVTAMASEARDPRRSIPRLIALMLGVCGLSYVAMIWIQVPVLSSNLEALESGESPTTILAHVGNVSFLAAPLDLLLAAATFAGLVATINYGSRIIGTAAADGLLPKGLSRIHPVYRSPVTAIVFIGVIAGGLPVLLQLISSASPLESSVYLYTFYVYFYLLPYVLAAIAAVVMLVREGGFRIFQIVTVTGSGLAWGYFFWFGLSHSDEGVFGMLPWLSLILTMALFLIFAIVQWRSPSRISKLEEVL
ncbi:APC family permease [Parahaliea maris]|nr:APC family permease [Parahaliea maris]